ncbi:DUF805 domain-containing protein [Sphingomonas sp.]|uniref:DUF805 domain-containing protein n=1 Tax=Sphingomonas sp. TaxID=28214 RepID=UPI003CC535B1
MNLVTGHLTRLADFSGRENRQPFWLWVLMIYIGQTILNTIVMIPLMLHMFSSMQAMTGQDPDYLNRHPEIAQQLVMSAMLPMMRTLVIAGMVMGLIAVGLIAAAVVRRLHDGNRSGWWAAPLLVAQVVTLTLYLIAIPHFLSVVSTMGPQTTPDQANAAMASVMPVFLFAMLSGVIGFGLMIVLIIQLASRGTIGPNRYGDDLLPPPQVWRQPQWQGGPPPQWQGGPPPQWQGGPPPQWQPPAPPPPPSPARIVRPWGDPPAQL